MAGADPTPSHPHPAWAPRASPGERPPPALGTPEARPCQLHIRLQARPSARHALRPACCLVSPSPTVCTNRKAIKGSGGRLALPSQEPHPDWLPTEHTERAPPLTSCPQPVSGNGSAQGPASGMSPGQAGSPPPRFHHPRPSLPCGGQGPGGTPQFGHFLGPVWSGSLDVSGEGSRGDWRQLWVRVLPRAPSCSLTEGGPGGMGIAQEAPPRGTRSVQPASPRPVGPDRSWEHGGKGGTEVPAGRGGGGGLPLTRLEA